MRYNPASPSTPMALAAGTRLGPYEIVVPLGAGGMGEVYRARDTKLGRDVALKLLPAQFAEDGERLARFEREARTLAALNHPHIAQVYGFEEGAATAGAPAVCALVMELVPGENLAARIARGPLPLREALDLARQVADGLEAAHEKGIVHRDLKPANVQVTPEGQAKILDFGLAKATVTEVPDDDAATLTSPAQMTQAGIVLGTAAYMSPEQARGATVDARTDVWAFGALIYELLTGARPFPGPTMSDTLAQILERDPDWTKLPSATPAIVRALVQRCLRKDPKQRLRNISDARFTLEDTLAALASTSSGVAVDATGVNAIPAPPARAVWRHPLPLGLAFASLALGGALAWSLGRTPAAPSKEPLYLSLMLPPDQEIAGGGLALSPNGQDLVYPAVAEEGPPGPEGNIARLYHRRITEPVARPLPGTENAWEPFFSADGRSVAFVSSGDLKLRKMALSGGGPVELAPIPWLNIQQGPGSWTAAGAILLPDSTGPARRVQASGGSPEVIVPRAALEAGELGAVRPRALPGGKTLFVAWTGGGHGKLAVWDGATRRTLVSGVGQAYSLFGGGHLLYWQRAGGTQGAQWDLCVVPFDPERAEVKGEPVALLSEAGVPVSELSDEGTLIYRRPGGGPLSIQYSWLARGDQPAPAPFGPLPRSDVPSFRISPDGRHVLYSQALGPDDWRLAVADLATRTSRTVVAGMHVWAIWTPDGRRAIYQERSGEADGFGLAWKPVDGSGPAELLTKTKGWQQPQFVTRDGRYLVYEESGGLGASEPKDQTYDLWLLPLVPRGEPRALVRTKANERLAHVSPDERWMAYVSDETGRDEVWVRAFPEGGAVVQVSQDGGTEPLWAPDGRTLYYRDWSGTMLSAVPVTAGAVPQFGTPVVTRGFWSRGLPFGRRYDVDLASGALLFQTAGTLGREIRVVLNFDAVIRRKLGDGGRAR
jgi:hypothetical protein